MSYRVIADFRDLEDGRRLYKKDKPYPREGYEPTQERIMALTTSNNAGKKPFIIKIESKEPPSTDADVFPKATGGGYYQLSNGEKVKGKDKALAAEEALKGA